MQHFLEISQVPTSQIKTLLERALYFKHSGHHPAYPQCTLANLFYEPSTRTRVSFELAAQRLSMPVVNLDIKTSSETKGEELEDTLRTLAAMGISHCVMRHKQEYIQQHMATTLGNQVHIINAGDGTHAHPSQAILDMMTILEHKPKFDQLKIAVVGNIKHSRVANSFQYVCKLMGVGELVLVAPELWQPKALHYGRVTSNFEEGVRNADVIMTLRVQYERLLESDKLDAAVYRESFALTEKNIVLAKPDVMVLHPGPMNRGLEIDSEVADGPNSFILNQVRNGVFARMAILEALV